MDLDHVEFLLGGILDADYKLWRRALLQDGGCEGLVRSGHGDSIPSVFNRKLLSCEK